MRGSISQKDTTAVEKPHERIHLGINAGKDHYDERQANQPNARDLKRYQGRLKEQKE